MDKEQVIVHIANEMFQTASFSVVTKIVRDFCLMKAEEHYNQLSEEERTKLGADLEKAFTQATKASEEAEEPQVTATAS